MARTLLRYFIQIQRVVMNRCPMFFWSLSPEGKQRKKEKASIQNCVFILKRLSFKLDLPEPTWFGEIKFSDIPGIRDRRAKTLFPIEIKQVSIFYKPEFWGLPWLWKFILYHLLLALAAGEETHKRAHRNTAVKLPWVLENWKKVEATAPPNGTTPNTLNFL